MPEPRVIDRTTRGLPRTAWDPDAQRRLHIIRRSLAAYTCAGCDELIPVNSTYAQVFYIEAPRAVSRWNTYIPMMRKFHWEHVPTCASRMIPLLEEGARA